ncbi:MAG: c-type cytochrome, partial [Gemmatimonadota bacterium]|nr:c-type cytochrome [Gemmatimonadota bacterium]
LQCMICHSEREWSEPGAPPREDRRGAGKVFREEGDARIVASNLTPDPETGIGEWTDEELAHAIRRGIGRDGRRLHPLMYYNSFRHLSDADVEAVIAYLRSLEPVRNPLPDTKLPEDERERLEAAAPTELDPVDLSSPDPLERGRALVTLGDCRGCHTAWSGPRGPLYAGGNRIQRGERVAYSSNITPHPTGMPYGPDAFVTVMRSGKGGTLSPLMPWIVFRQLSDEDLRAMHAFLQTVLPFPHQVNNRVEPTACEVCGQSHGLGDENALDAAAEFELDPAEYDRYTGSYHSPARGFTLTVTAGDSGLRVRAGDRPPAKLVPISRNRFWEGWRLRVPVRFEFGDAGDAQRLVVERPAPDGPVVLEKREDGP